MFAVHELAAAKRLNNKRRPKSSVVTTSRVPDPVMSLVRDLVKEGQEVRVLDANTIMIVNKRGDERREP